jgi:hypothetical protein
VQDLIDLPRNRAFSQSGTAVQSPTFSTHDPLHDISDPAELSLSLVHFHDCLPCAHISPHLIRGISEQFQKKFAKSSAKSRHILAGMICCSAKKIPANPSRIIANQILLNRLACMSIQNHIRLMIPTNDL